MNIEVTSKGYFHSISEFKFLQDIGVGSFGKVKLALHLGTRKHFAIKIVDLDENLSETEVQMVIREIKIHQKLDHPHIVKLWETLIETNKIYMVMDYAKNGSLFRYHSGLLQKGLHPQQHKFTSFFIKLYKLSSTCTLMTSCIAISNRKTYCQINRSISNFATLVGLLIRFLH